MYRDIVEKLVAWKESSNRKILLLTGDRGVGKTYLLKDLAEGCFAKYVYMDMKKQAYVKSFFEGEFTLAKFRNVLELESGIEITKGDTFIILENIDCIKSYREIIKIIAENMAQYHVAVTLSVSEDMWLENNSDIKQYLDIYGAYPLNFKEFLYAIKKEDFISKIESNKKDSLSVSDKKELVDIFKTYLYVGGMPSVVKCYISTRDMEKVEQEKQRIVDGYNEGIESIDNIALKRKVRHIWDSVEAQMTDENKKFQYGTVKLTARAREYKEALDWLCTNRYLFKVNRVKKAELPMELHRDEKSFEIYVTDVGILTAIFKKTCKEIMSEKNISKLCNAAVIEQYVYQELRANENISKLYYWVSRATARIEFMFTDERRVIPVEINLEQNAKAQSIKVYKNMFECDMYISITLDTMRMYGEALRIPVFSIWNL